MNRLEITGKKFNRLTALRFIEVVDKKFAIWEFKCDCGKLVKVKAAWVTSGNTGSCGCLRSFTHPGYNKLPDGEASFNSLFSSYKYSARIRGIEFELTEEEFRELSKKSCIYCGSPPSQISKKKTATTPYIYTGVDRVDNSKGYKIKNVVPCCKFCNYAKNKMSVEQFILWLDRLVVFRANPEGGAKSTGENSHVLSENPV